LQSNRSFYYELLFNYRLGGWWSNYCWHEFRRYTIRISTGRDTGNPDQIFRGSAQSIRRISI